MIQWLLITLLVSQTTATPSTQQEAAQTSTAAPQTRPANAPQAPSASTADPAVSTEKKKETGSDYDKPKGWRRISYGGRVRAFPLRMIENRPYTADRASNQRWSYTSTDRSHHFGLGAEVDYGLTGKLALGTELLFHSVEFQKVTIHYLISDSTKSTQLTEMTKVRFWDVPLMLRYWGVGREGWRSHVVLSSGPVLRVATNVRTGTVFNYQSGNTGYNELRDEPAKRNLLGAVAGMGYRLVDDAGFKVTPEIRFTRWLGRTYASDSTQSRRGQVEAGLAITF